ncbi:polyhomeotic-like protein 2b isoform X1 [Hemibagrus wyckioides]|nr:polyhomeotic-like protein 2b isoform X1 [Hemibagrus wyckioides]XP_058259894.1 polyhomeotic-like protein 2b isoform X1 [Hemibagrus wyckioides]XP_058259895.1 polyhomeotic-like protein 2b isoform X1 [Hemibagrus wyckioides]
MPLLVLEAQIRPWFMLLLLHAWTGDQNILSLNRLCQRGSRGSKLRRQGGTMEGEQGPPASSASMASTSSSSTNTTSSTTSTSSTPNTTNTTNTSTVPSSSSASSSSSTSSGRQTVSQISVYSGIPDRQTVQVIQQALHRQPSTAAQYLQQMYAAQQQHLMLQTAALQQQHLSTAQLQSLAAVQQASIAAGRQNSTQNGTSSTQSGSSQTTINLTTSPATAQLISRAQSVNSSPSAISQQAVLLGNASSPTLTATQAQMYLRAQMAQQSNLVHVARSLGRAVPLSPQLILAPTATVTALQSDTSGTSNTQSASAQVQNLALRSHQGATSSSQSTGLQALSLKQTPVSIQPTPLIKTPSQSASNSGTITGKGGLPVLTTDGGKKPESGETEAKAVNMSRSVTSSQPLITPTYAQIQPQALIKQQTQQFVIQSQAPPTPRMQTQLLQTASIQPHPQATASLGLQSSSAGGPVPVLPKPPGPSQGSAPSQQATIFHSTVSQHSGLNQSKAQPVQLTAINLQIQPAHSQASRLAQDSKDKPTSLVIREICPPLGAQVPTSAPSQDTNPPEPPKADTGTATGQTQGAVETPSTASMTPRGESEPANGENKPPQAIVKPHVLTHVIEGFVIQEGAEPFPVERPPVQTDSLKKSEKPLPSDSQKTPLSNAPTTTDSEPEEPSQQDPAVRDEEDTEEPKLTCELCGRVDFAYKFKGSKRFCSVVCAKRYNVGCTKRIGLFHPDRSKTANRWRRRSHSRGCRSTEAKKQRLSVCQQSQGESVSSPLPSQPSQGESSPCSDISSYEEPPSPLSAASSSPVGPPRGPSTSDPEDVPTLSEHFLPCDPTKWNVQEVFEFIHSLPGCQEIADEFRSQEIDGQAMLLLKEDHLMSAMNIKLGPALKIFARINMLKDS